MFGNILVIGDGGVIAPLPVFDAYDYITSFFTECTNPLVTCTTDVWGSQGCYCFSVQHAAAASLWSMALRGFWKQRRVEGEGLLGL